EGAADGVRLTVVDAVVGRVDAGQVVRRRECDGERARVPAARERSRLAEGRRRGDTVDLHAVHRAAADVAGPVGHGRGRAEVVALAGDRAVGGDAGGVDAGAVVGRRPVDRDVALVPA